MTTASASHIIDDNDGSPLNVNEYTIDELLDIYHHNMTKTFKASKYKSLEYEMRFGNRDVEINQVIFHNTFQSLIAKGFEVVYSNYSMKIQSDFNARDGVKKQSNIRIELDNLENIQYLCSTNTLPKSDKIKFVRKTHYNDDVLPKPSYNNEFAFRTSIQEETILDPYTNDVVKSIMSRSNWESQKKIFRYIHRTSLVHKKYPHFRIDLSVVKQNYKNKQVKFTDSNVLNSRPDYEIEMELVDFAKVQNLQKLKNDMKKVVQFILCGIQNTKYPISLGITNNVLRTYFDLVKIGQDHRYKKSSNFIGPSSVTLQRHNVVKHDDLETVCIQDEFCVTDKADGERRLMIINEKGSLYFIDTNLNVTFTGLTTSNKSLFNTLLDGEHITQNKFHQSINLYAVFDIYVYNRIDLRKKPFYVTDKLKYVKERGINHAVKDDGNVKLTTRYEVLSKVVKLLKNSETTKSVSKHASLSVELKEFKATKPEKNISIFDCCKYLLGRINSNTYAYNTDGLIFTSKLLGVGQEFEGDEIKNRRYTWEHSFKWKPPEYNTIDFLVEIKKDKLGHLDLKTKRVNGDLVQYYECYLKIGYDKTRHKNKQLVLLNLDHENKSFHKNSKNNNNYQAEYFFPTNPSDETAHICHIPLRQDNTGNLVMITEEGDLMNDDEIVEFRYDVGSNDKYMGWKPLRTRQDKTREYKTGGKNFGNAYHVANNNWQSIHNPVKETMLTRDGTIEIETILTEQDDVYYNGTKIKSKTGPLRDFHNKFVKKWIIQSCASKQPKTTLLDLAVGKGGDLPKWIMSNIHGVLGIDISKDNIINPINGACHRYIKATGKAKNVPICMFIQGNTGRLISNGDFARSEYNTSFASQYSSTKVMNFKENVDKPDVDAKDQSFINMDTNEGMSVEIFNALLGIGNKKDQSVPYLQKYFGIFHEKFDICSIQFALHYMFKDVETFHSFLKNVSDYTKKGKYFIGTCYDGELLYDTLKDLEKGDKMERFINDHKIWHIKKGYDNDDETFNSGTEACLGYKVSVFQETINKEFDEYLVNFTYLIKVLQDYGFEVNDNMGSIPSIGNFKELFDLMIEEETERGIHHYDEAYKMHESEKFVSFLNKYFIFKKVNDVDTDLVFNYYINYEEKDTNLTIERAKKTSMTLKLSMV
jgi:hypothetical protein